MKAEWLNYLFILLSIIFIPLVVIVILLYYSFTFWTLLGLGLILPSSVLIIIARVQLGKSFALSAQAKELVTHWLYSKIRHPIFVVGLVLVLGLTLCMRTVPMLCLLLTLFLIQAKKRLCTSRNSTKKEPGCKDAPETSHKRSFCTTGDS